MHGFEQQEFKEDFKVNLVPIKREYNRSGGFISECQSKDEFTLFWNTKGFYQETVKNRLTLVKRHS